MDAQNAYDQGTTIDTLTLNFGFFTVAQPQGLAVLNGILRNATQVDSTTVTGGATVTRNRPRADSGALCAGLRKRGRPAKRCDREQGRD